MAMVRLYTQDLEPKSSRFKPELCYLLDLGLWTSDFSSLSLCCSHLCNGNNKKRLLLSVIVIIK